MAACPVSGEDSPFELAADIVIDGSGAGGFLAKALPIDSALDEVELDTSLVFGHFDGAGSLPGADPRSLSRSAGGGPPPAGRGLDVCVAFRPWCRQCRHPPASSDAMEELTAAGHDSPEADLARGASVDTQPWRGNSRLAVPTRPLEIMPRVQRRLESCAGERWAVLPHTYSFLDPLFSMGIAWSLVAVERLSMIFADGSDQRGPDAAAIDESLLRYGRQLAVEAQQMATLLDGAYLAMQDLDLFAAQSFLYFATVSFEEVNQRLFPKGHAGLPPAWRGFLGAGDTQLESTLRRVEASAQRDARRHRGATQASWSEPILPAGLAKAIASRNIAGLGDPSRRNLYPVDLDLLVERADLLGLTPHEMRLYLPRLRGIGEGA